MPEWSALTQALIDAAIREDLANEGDITSALMADPGAAISARVIVRQSGVVCGLALAPAICAKFAARLGAPLSIVPSQHAGVAISDGFAAESVTPIATLSGPRTAVLAIERTLLNFMGRMSGVATLTRQYVAAAHAANPNVAVLDTRKTLPGWRELDRYAVRTGGGTNHRWGLFDAVLLKDNHLAGIPANRLANELQAMLSRLRDKPTFVEVEVDSLEQFDEVCKVPGIDFILLDNFTLDQLREAVRRRNAQPGTKRPALEASGGVTLKTIAAIAATGVERISAGALTHSAPNLDLALDF